MLRKHSVLIGILSSLVLLVLAIRYYPGGSQFDKNSVGYDWKNNYLSNLFSIKAVNGVANASRIWAIFGMFFLCISGALFFVGFSEKIPRKGAAKIISCCGAFAMVFAFLAVTPYHDTMITIATTLALVSMFYIAVFIFRSKLYFLKILSVVCLLVSYCCNYVYYTKNYLEILPVLQKITLVTTIVWILALHYFTTSTDFQSGKPVGPGMVEGERKPDDYRAGL